MPAHLTQQEKIAIVTLYHTAMRQEEIAAIFDRSTATIYHVVRQTKDSTTDHSLQGLLSSPFLRPSASTQQREENRGSKHKVPLGSVAATAIRRDALGKYHHVEPCEAANDTIDDLIREGVVKVEDLEANETREHKRRRLAGEIDDRDQVMRWLSRADVFRIRTNPQYYLADPEHKKPIHHKRGQTKPKAIAGVVPITM
jgi:hypothetical protein